MKNLILGTVGLLLAWTVTADYYNDAGDLIKESSLERDLREQVACLSDKATNPEPSDCGVLNESLYYEGEVLGDSISNGVVEFYISNEVAADGRSLSDFKKIVFDYSGSDISQEDASFSHYQNCYFLKDAIENSNFLNNYSPSLEAWDQGLSLGDNMTYVCDANPELNIGRTQISGKVVTSSGQEDVTVTRDMGCNARPVVWQGIVMEYDMTCSNGLKYWVSRHNKLGPNIYCPEVTGAGLTTCEVTQDETHTFDYARKYTLTATPTDIINGSIHYGIDIDYTVTKHRTLPVSEWEGLAPVDVSGITIFVPVAPNFPNQGYTDSQYAGSDSVAFFNETQVKIGCNNSGILMNMSEGSDTLGIWGNDPKLLACDGVTLSFNNLNAINDLYWDLLVTWGDDEASIWSKYADYLTSELRDELISQRYIYALSSVVNQTSNDTKIVLAELSNKIFGSTTYGTGLRGYLTANQDLWSVNIEEEINKLSTDSTSPYGEGVLEIGSTLPPYWISFLVSSEGENILALEKVELITKVKNIVDVSAGNGEGLEEASTLAEVFAPLLTEAQENRQSSIYKASQLIDVYIESRSDIQTAITEEIAALESVLNERLSE